MVLLSDGLYRNHAVYKRDIYEINIERLNNSFIVLTIFRGFFSISLDSQCGPSIRYDKYKIMNSCHIVYISVIFILIKDYYVCNI